MSIEQHKITIQISDDELSDLSRRLKATRWPANPGNQDSFYGINGTYLRDLVDYWINEFDWRAAEKRLNAMSHPEFLKDLSSS